MLPAATHGYYGNGTAAYGTPLSSKATDIPHQNRTNPMEKTPETPSTKPSPENEPTTHITERIRRIITQLEKQGIQGTGSDDLWRIAWRHQPGQEHWELAEVVLVHANQTGRVEAAARLSSHTSRGWGGVTFLVGSGPLMDQLATIPLISMETGKMLPHNIQVIDATGKSGAFFVTRLGQEGYAVVKGRGCFLWLYTEQGEGRVVDGYETPKYGSKRLGPFDPSQNQFSPATQPVDARHP